MSAFRGLRQLAASSSARALATRSLALASRTALPRAVAPASRAAFSVYARAMGQGASDVTLSQKLGEELEYEKQAAATAEQEPDFLKDFKANGIWSITDVQGNDEVILTRKFGGEDIRLIFSIADVHNAEEDSFDENEDAQENTEEESSLDESYPIRCAFSIKKSSAPGALTIDAMCQDGAFVIESISFYRDGQTATELTAEADWQRRGLYIGPQFDTLDVAVQDEFEKFLTERGINESLAFFIPLFAEHKEQKEYVSWLDGVKKFIDA